MPFLYAMLAPAGIVWGIDGLMYAWGIELPGFWVNMEVILGGRPGLGFGSCLWLAEGALILLRHRAGLWLLWAALGLSSLPSIWLVPVTWREVLAAVLIPLLLGLWGWTHRGWFQADRSEQAASHVEE